MEEAVKNLIREYALEEREGEKMVRSYTEVYFTIMSLGVLTIYLSSTLMEGGGWRR